MADMATVAVSKSMLHLENEAPGTVMLHLLTAVVTKWFRKQTIGVYGFPHYSRKGWNNRAR